MGISGLEHTHNGPRLAVEPEAGAHREAFELPGSLFAGDQLTQARLKLAACDDLDVRTQIPGVLPHAPDLHIAIEPVALFWQRPPRRPTRVTLWPVPRGYAIPWAACVTTTAVS